MRKAMFLVVGIMFVISFMTLLSMNMFFGKTSSEDSIFNTKDSESVIASTCRMFDTIVWTEEELARMESFDTIEGNIVKLHPWILIKGAERELDTCVNHYNISFTTEK